MAHIDKIYIYVYLIFVSVSFVIISLLSATVYKSINDIRMQELYSADIEKFEHIETVVDYVDEKAKSACVSQFLDYNNYALMYSTQYSAELGNQAIKNFSNQIFADGDFQSAYIYNNVLGKYFGIAVEDTESEKLFDSIKDSYGGKLPILKAVPIIMKSYNSDRTDDVLSYIIYEDIDTNNMPVGAIVLNIKLEKIVNAARRAGGKSRIILLDSDKRVIADTYNETGFLSRLPQKIMTSAEKSLENGAPEFCHISNHKTVVNSFAVKNIGWTYINITNYNDYFQPIHNVGKKIIIMTVLFLLLSAIAAIYISKIISSPVTDFVNKISKMSEKESKRQAEKTKYALPTPVSFIKDYFSGIEVDIEKHIKVYAQGQRNENIRNGLIFGHDYGIDINGYIIMYRIFDYKQEEIYSAHVFNMVKTYIESNCRKNFDFVVLDKRRAVAVLNESHDVVLSLCHKAIDDAALCNVTISSFVGRYVSDLKQLQSEFKICGRMSIYQLMKSSGFVYDYMQYEKDEKRKTDFSNDNMNAAINRIIENTDRDGRRKEIEKYLESILNNNVANYINICHHLMDAMQKIYTRIVLKHDNAFGDENMKISTAETYYDMLSVLSRAADITSEAFAQMHSQTTENYRTVVEFITSNIADTQLSPSMIAERLNVSQRKLSNSFKCECGHSLLDEINEIRLKRVIQLLMSTDKSIKAIMQECGFVSESNFYKLFKKYYGVTPAEYKKYKENSDKA